MTRRGPELTDTTLTAGTRVSEYVLEERIGDGGFGEVWRARHRLWADHVVAVKFATSEEFVRQLRNEGVLQRQLQHPGIARVLGVDVSCERPYVLSEFVPGGSLRELLRRRGRLPAGEALELLRQILDALRHAHERGVLHLDIKPENILLTADGRTKIADFGLARPLSGSDSLAISGKLATEKSVTGTLPYLAPEQRSGNGGAARGKLDARTDLYALGVVLFEMLTGALPEGAELPRQLDPDLPRWTDRLVSRLYARLDRRYPSAAAVIAALPAAGAPDDNADGSAGRAGSPHDAAPAPAPPPARSRATVPLPHPDLAPPPRWASSTPAGAVVRTFAFIIDLVIFAGGAAFAFAVFPPLRALETLFAGRGPAPILGALLLVAILQAACHALVGKTPGKHLMGLRVVTSGGKRLGPFRSLVRSIVCLLHLAPLPVFLPLGFFWVALAPRKRGLHDIIAGTRVVHG